MNLFGTPCTAIERVLYKYASNVMYASDGDDTANFTPEQRLGLTSRPRVSASLSYTARENRIARACAHCTRACGWSSIKGCRCCIVAGPRLIFIILVMIFKAHAFNSPGRHDYLVFLFSVYYRFLVRSPSGNGSRPFVKHRTR